jgi:hypothetical protein
MTKNLFQAVKTYINGVEVGETFTTKHLIDMVGDHEVSSFWKQSNQNPYYRTHTYKSYLRRTGFISNPKRGEWKVERHIPDFVNLGTIEFLIGFKYKSIYNGMTRSATIEKINNLQYKSPLLEDFPTKPGFVEKRLSLQEEHEKQMNEIFDGETTQQFLAEIGMEGQMLSQLIMTQPIEEIRYLVEERENLDKIRILSEIKEDKIMKVEFDFVEGIGRIKKYLENSLQQEEEFLFRDVKLCNDKDDLKQVLVEYELTERRIEQAIECLDDADNISEVLIAVEDTTLSGLDETVIGLLFNVDITIR